MAAAQSHTAKREAREFLLALLESGPVKQDDRADVAKQEGIAKRTLDRAKKELGVRSWKKRGKSDGAWLGTATHPLRESWQPS
jgi:hypothetical protein